MVIACVPMRFAELVEEEVVALQGADDGCLQLAPQRLGEPEQQRIREVDDVERLLSSQPFEQLLDLLSPGTPAGPLSMETVISPRLFASTLIDRLVASFKRPRGVPQLVDKPRRVTEQGRVLLEENADPAEEDLLAADVLLVGLRRRVHGRQHDVVAAAQQLGGERVVPQAAAAIHGAGAAGERQDPHGSRRRPPPGTIDARTGARTDCLRAADPS
jgi:hypothetical protein